MLSVPAYLSPASTSTTPSIEPSPGPDSIFGSSSAALTSSTPLPGPGHPAQLFTLQHLDLLRHAEFHLMRSLEIDTDKAANVWQTIFSCALHAPFLMDQLLALSAAHLSVLHPDQRAFYLHQAAELQTRGLSLFNASQASHSVNPESPEPESGPEPESEPDSDSARQAIAVFLYSSHLGLHVMFDTFRDCDDSTVQSSDFVDRLTAYLAVHRGVRATTGRRTWTLVATELSPLIQSHEFEPPDDGEGVGHECDPLFTLIDGADCSVTTAATLREVTKHLQWAFNIHRRMSAEARAKVVLAWPIVLPPAFADMVRQRRPEAWVILAYYAVLLHQSRGFWVFGDGGRFLLRAILAHLGSYWDDWLVWPREMIEMDCDAR